MLALRRCQTGEGFCALGPETPQLPSALGKLVPAGTCWESVDGSWTNPPPVWKEAPLLLSIWTRVSKDKEQCMEQPLFQMQHTFPNDLISL